MSQMREREKKVAMVVKLLKDRQLEFVKAREMEAAKAKVETTGDMALMNYMPWGEGCVHQSVWVRV